MKNNRKIIGLICSFHQHSINFHFECLQSILNQTDKDFHLYLFADQVYIPKPVCNTIPIDYESVENLSPKEIRGKGVSKAYRDGCNYIMFVDSDDIMHLERIKIIRKYLADNSPNILIHNLSTINQKSNIIKEHVFRFDKKAFDNQFYWWKNNSGLGNTVYRSELLYELLPFPEKTKTLDWTIIFILSLNNLVSVLDKSLMFYRQHEHNKLGINQQITKRELFYKLEVIDAHYDVLVDYFSSRNKNSENLKLIASLRCEWARRKQIVLSDIESYLKSYNKIADNLMWNQLI